MTNRVRFLFPLLLLVALVFNPAWAAATAISLQVPGGAVNGEIIKVKVLIDGGSEGISFETEGLQYVRGYFDHCGFCGKPCLVNDTIQACPSAPDGCCFSLYCLGCSYSSGHEFSDRWYGGPTVEYRVNACLGPNPTRARIRGRWLGGSHEGPYYTPWYEIAVGNPIVASFDYLPTDPLCAGDPIRFENTSCGGTDWHWDFGDGETAEGRVVVHTFTDPGSYPVTLTVTSSSGIDTETRTLNLRGDCATIQGTVTDNVDGRPLPGAVVELSRAGWKKLALAFQGGQYLTRVAPDHTYVLVGSYRGYFESPPGSASPGPNETVTVDLSLAPEPEEWTHPDLTALANLGRQYDAIADPVNPFVGNFFFNRTLFGFPGRMGQDLAFAVSYNSHLAGEDGPLGFGWTHSLAMRVEENGEDHTVVMPDGSRRFFKKSGTTYTPFNCTTTATLADRSPEGWSLTFPDGLAWLFDLDGRLTKITNPRNHSITLTHSTQLDRITDSMGRQIDLTWTGGRITAITTPAAGGPTAQFAYDGNGNLTSLTDARGHAWTFTYDAQHRLRTETDRRGIVVLTNTYGADGRIASQADAAGQLTTFAATPLAGNRLQVVVTPPSGNAITQVYDANGQLLQVADGEGHSATFGWDAHGNLAAATDKLGHMVAFENDARGNLVSTTDRIGATTTVTYNGLGQPTEITGPTGKSWFTYFANGNPRALWLLEVPLAGLGYDGQNQITTVDHNGRKLKYQYNAQGMRTSIQDPTGKAFLLAYDAAGRPTQVTLPDGLGNFQYTWDPGSNLTSLTNPAGHQTTFAYDAENNITSRTFVPTNATAALTYDALGRVHTETDALGGVTTYAYDADSNVVAVTDADGVTTNLAYDRRNLLRTVTYPSGNQETISRDANGRETALTNGLGHTWQAAFDAEGRPTELRNPLGAVTKLARGPDSRDLTMINALGEKDRLAFSGLGEPTAVTAANGDGISAQYDHYGSVSRLVDARGSEWRFAYDLAGRVTAVTGADGATERYAYDALGRLVTLTRPSGEEVAYQYTPDGRLSRITLPGGAQVDFGYAYSAAGLVVTVTEPLGVSTYTYDKLDRLINRTDAQGNTVRFSYTPAGRVASVTYPGNRQLVYTYDGAGRVQRLTDWTGKVTTFQYDGVDRLARVDLPNGTATVYAYDPVGRLTSLTHRGPGGSTLLSYTIARDAVGRVTAMTTTGTLTPAFGDADRERSVDSANRLLFEKAGAELATFAFDADGRQVERRLGAEVTTYSYDPHGNLSGVTGGGRATTYVRDVDGSCLRTVTNGVETRYLRDGNELWATLDAANTPTRFFIGTGTILYTLDPAGTARVLHTDPQGNVVGVSDGSGALVARFAYDPYGRTVAAEGQSELGWLGSHGVVTDDNGLLHTGVRMYDPASRRFLTEDPLGVLVASNLYAYTDGDPLNFMDPAGLQPAPDIRLWNVRRTLTPAPSYPTPRIPSGWGPDIFKAHVDWIEKGLEVGRDAGALVPSESWKLGEVYITEQSATKYLSSQGLEYGMKVVEVDYYRTFGTAPLRSGPPDNLLLNRMSNQWTRQGVKSTFSGKSVTGQLVRGIEGGAQRTVTGSAVKSAAGGLAGRLITPDLLPLVGWETARFASSSLVYIYNENTGRYETGDEVVANSFIPWQVAAWAPREDSSFELKKRLHKIKRDFNAGLKRNAPSK
ncbi:MAG TPA: RHS repeat-associated core domain-containing protein [Thermoanaerobaculaceae bacterium]|nr:RHS repeat-associated core domain-containing protein [Thermoanaerobaculaceae bacterium]